jgi:CTP:molybdopterin cytidylyltransferase MocA
LADADGLPAVRRIADVAWSGGATPIVVVAHDPDGAVAAALAGSPVTLAEPAPDEAGPAGQMARGIEVATATVRETTGALIWPAGMTWVGPETVTSLIEAHGIASDLMQTPSFEGKGGWPVLVPVRALDHFRAFPPTKSPDEVMDHLADVGVPFGVIDLGDPGTTIDRSTPRADLPQYVGPMEPPTGHVHEWGATIADDPDEGPLEGPALAPYGQAGGLDPD